MYQSPIDVIVGKMQTKFENGVLEAVQKQGIFVDKEELIKALQYDREQYEKGYADGLRERNEWISVDDRLPDDGRNYLCRCIINGNTEYPFFMVLHYILIDENPHFQHECDQGLKVTHWMPLPEPPKGE